VPGILFFLKPYIVNTEMLGGEYFHNLVHRDYPLYANFGVQSIYNFWDRTGDILFLYFHKDLKHDSGYFSKVMNNFAKEYRQSTPYLKLNALYEQVTELLSLRHEAVHHFQIEAKHYWATLSYMKTTKKEIRRMAT
jgi:hypothetical protein